MGQDAVIEAVANANPNTIVVLETGNPVAMPWRDKVRAILQAWYPGQASGQAVAEVVTGGGQPLGSPADHLPGKSRGHASAGAAGPRAPWGTPTTIRYDEGAEVGYRGCGLSYTSFGYSDLEVEGGETITATSTGERAGASVPSST
jgi:beta-glucosidase